MVTKRDEKVIRFLSTLRVARSSVLISMFYPSYRVGARRLTQLVSDGEMKRCRTSISTEYVYYLYKKPKQLKHALVLTDVCQKINQNVKIERFYVERQWGDIRPDATCIYRDKHGKLHVLLIEIDISNNTFGQKYKGFNYGQFFGSNRPDLLIVTDKPIPDQGFTTIIINPDLSGFHM